ncbi:MAG: DNA mismatch repair protein MutS [Deltaproteobacteria bacterium]|nr:MAG: DNA mismatch repair protein MutS [Deltaproteobacteria bacterium]
MAKKPFHNPFGKLKLPPKPSPARPPPAPPPPPRAEPLSEEDLWSLATEGAEALADRSARIRPAPQPLSLQPVRLDPELEAYDELRALVTGEVPFDIADTDEFIEGHVRGLDPRIVRRLKRGDLAVQGHLDLHGLLKEAAKLELEQFLARSRQQQKRCVLVVHGRGLHSKDQVPVLKESLKRWMRTERFSRHVLAFATARPHDGGAGAIYVLLKRS